MTTERDPRTRIVLSWLREDGHENAERVLLQALDEVDATPQRRPRWPARRDIQMNIYAKTAIGAAAALIVVLVGLRLLPGPSGPGHSANPSPSPSPSIAVTPPPSSTPTLPQAGAIAPGTYLVQTYTQTPFRVTVAAGWTVDAGMLHKGDFYNGRDAVLLRPWIVSHVYADACHWRGTMQPVGTTKAELVAAISAQTGRDATGPDEVVLGGLPATKFVISVPGDFDASGCDDGYLRPFPGTGGNEGLSPPMFVGSITTIYVIETDGLATAIQAARYEGSAPADVAALQAVVDSIQFQP